MTSGFLARWAKRKALAKLAETERSRRPEPSAETAPTEARTEAAGAPPVEPSRKEPPILPDLATLTLETDFTAFMAQGVPRETRNEALRKLWRMDPVFANRDGLNDYDEDYTDTALVKEGMKTAYRIGRGFLDQLKDPDGAAVAAAGQSDESVDEVAGSIGNEADGVAESRENKEGLV